MRSPRNPTNCRIWNCRLEGGRGGTIGSQANRQGLRISSRFEFARARGRFEIFRIASGADRGPRENAYSQKFSNSKFSQVEKNSIRKPSKTSHEPHASKHERSESDPQQAKTICIVAWQARAPDIIATQADADTASCRILVFGCTC